jgi:hypothetical protein
VVGGLGAMLFFFVASRVVKCAFDQRRTVKKLERRAKLRRQMELRLRRTMLRRVARRLADDAVQYARLAEETGGELSNRGNLSGNIRGHSQTNPVARRAVGSPVAALDLGIVEIARSPRVASPRGTDVPVRSNRGWRGPGSFLEYQRGDEDGGSPASPTSPSGRGDTQSGVRTPARVAASRAAAAAAAAQAVALAAAKLAILAEQQLRDAEAELSSNSDGDDDDDDEFMKELAGTGKGGADGGGVGGSGASTPGGGGGVRLDRGARGTSEREVGDGTMSSALVGLSDVEIGLGELDAPPGTYGSEGRGDSNDDLFDTITVPNSGASYRVSDAGGLDGAITDLGDAELEALYARSYERALMRADAEAAIAETRERAGRRSSPASVRAPSAATRATRFGAPPRPPR